MAPLILLTNDDGIESPGLAAAVRAVMDLGEVLVVAPSTQQTAAGRSFRGRKDAILERHPLSIEGREVEAWHLDASPALVVRHALQTLCRDRRPDLVVSGINYGENLGTSVSASGTLGAALEGALHHIPALAASLQMSPEHFFHHAEQDWGAAIHHVHAVATLLLSRAMPFDVDVLKVDVPEDATADTPRRLCRLSRQPYFVNHLDEPHAGSRIDEGRLAVHLDHAVLEPDSDVHALAVDRVVALTPLSVDCSSRVDLGTLERLLERP